MFDPRCHPHDILCQGDGLMKDTPNKRCIRRHPRTLLPKQGRLPFVDCRCMCVGHKLEWLNVLPGYSFLPSFEGRDSALVSIGDDPVAPASALGPGAFPDLKKVLSEAHAIIIWVGGYETFIQFAIKFMGMRWRIVEIDTQAEQLENWQVLIPPGRPYFKILPRQDWDFETPSVHYPKLTVDFSKTFTRLTEIYPARLENPS